MADMPTGTVTFLFTDLESSTRMWEAHTAAMEAALERHDAIMREAIAAGDGFVFSTAGDAFSAAFSSPTAAIEAALQAQHALGAEPWPDHVALRVRMGLHTGEAQERDGDYFGPTLNRTARIMSAGHGGQVLLSDVTAGMVGRGGLRDLGEHRLKDLSGSERIWQVGQDRFPRLKTMDERRGNLPAPPSSFIGRKDDIPSLAAVVGGTRLTTLTGVGGVGKTRLSIAVADAVAESFPDGVWFCELAPIGDPVLVPHAIATVLGLQVQGGMTPMESVIDGLRGRSALLILDNCEHVLSASAELARGVVTGAPTVTVIATSREALDVSGERVWPVRSLDSASEAVDLFTDRAKSADLSFDPTAEQREVIEDICRRLDGIPLAIELAAARTRSMSVADIDKRLDDRFRLLRGSGRGGLERHQTLRATVQWSYDLLSEEEKALFGRLSVFAGRFDLAAAEAICSDDDLVDEYSIVDHLASLVEKSMVQADRSGETTTLSLLETFRQFGEEQLIDRGELADRRDRHLQAYLSRALRNRDAFEGPQWAVGKSGFEFDWDQVRAAAAWAQASGDVARLCDLTAPHFYFCFWTGRFELGGWLREAVQRPDLPAAGYWLAAWHALMTGEVREGSRLAGLGLAPSIRLTASDANMLWFAVSTASGRLGDWERRSEAIDGMRRVYEHETSPLMRAVIGGSLAAAEPFYEMGVAKMAEAMAAAHNLNNIPAKSYVSAMAALLHLRHGFLVDAELAYVDAVQFAAESALVTLEGLALTNLSLVRGRGDHADASRTFFLAIQQNWEHRSITNCLNSVEFLGVWLSRRGQDHAAATLLGFLDARFDLHPDESPDTLRRLRADPTLGDALARGAAMSRDEVVAYALSLTEERATSD